MKHYMIKGRSNIIYRRVKNEKSVTKYSKWKIVFEDRVMSFIETFLFQVFMILRICLECSTKRVTRKLFESIIRVTHI